MPQMLILIMEDLVWCHKEDKQVVLYYQWIDNISQLQKKIHYSTLTHNNAGTGRGYFNVKGAYSNYGSSCPQVVVRDCQGNVENENFQKCNNNGCAPYSQSGENPGNFGKMNYALGFDHHACEQAKKDKTNPLNC